MPRFSNKLETLRDFLNTRFKKISRAHWHASTAGMGALIRTAIGIINKRNGTKDRERQEDKENEGNYSKYIKMLVSLRAHATRHGKALGVAREQSRSNTARSYPWPLDRRSRFAPSR